MTPVIILARNNVAHTIACIEHVLLTDGVNVSILVIDNASSDGTSAKLRGYFSFSSQVSFMHLTKVQSVAHCWNRGIQRGLKLSDHSIVLNNDILVRPHTIPALVDHRWRGGVVSGVPVDSIDIEDIHAPLTTSRHPHFSSFLINRDCYQAVGPFDEGFEGAYFEDNDYHIRLVAAGFDGVGLNLPVLHVGSATRKSASPAELARIDSSYAHNKEYFRSKWDCLPGDDRYKSLTKDASAGAVD